MLHKSLAMLQVLQYEVSQMTYTEAHYLGSRMSKVTQEYS
jgi:hypothetical protein